MTRQIIGQWKDGPNGTYRRRRSASGKWYTEAIYTEWNDNPPPTKQVAADPLKSTRATPKSVEKAPNLWAWAILIFGVMFLVAGQGTGAFMVLGAVLMFVATS